MSVRRVIQEIHHRSLWQVLLIYLGGSYVAIQAVDLIALHLALPTWIPTLAIVLAVVGLPIVLATAFVQEAPAASPDTAEAAPAGHRAATVAPTTPIEPAAGPAPRLRRLLTWRNALVGAVGALALWGIGAAAYLAFSGGKEPAEPKIGSIAVLPLDDLSADSAHGYFADAMTEELITELAQVKELLVMSRTAVMRYREHPVPVREVAHDLGVDAVIEGSVVGGRTRRPGLRPGRLPPGLGRIRPRVPNCPRARSQRQLLPLGVWPSAASDGTVRQGRAVSPAGSRARPAIAAPPRAALLCTGV